MGPILEAIEAGHYATVSDQPPNQGDLVCAVDRELWPCTTLRAARKEQLQYADRLNQRIPDYERTGWPVAVVTR